MFKKWLQQFSLAILVMVSVPAYAVLEIEIDEGSENAMPIAIVPFQVDSFERPAEDIAMIVGADLRRSGYFKPLKYNQLPEQPAEMVQVNFNRWGAANTDYMVVGKIKQLGDKSYQIDMELIDVLRKQVILNKRWMNVRNTQFRYISHLISDLVYFELIGVKGAFATQIAYVTVQRQAQNKKLYTLEVADADGYNSQTILKSYEPIMSPSWSPDGSKLAYVSFENGRSEIFVQSIYGDYRKRLAGFTGINSSPAWSPDGSRLAMTLSKGGNADVYIMDLATGNLTQVTRDRAIETEAAWSLDGKRLYFSSDRRGQPQIFELNTETQQLQRLSNYGKYNSNPDLSPDGKSLAIVHNDGSGFNIALLDLETRQIQRMTSTFLDESPSFAPNGQMILYAMNKGGRGQLAVVSVEGRASQTLQVMNAEVKEPAWGPYPR